MIRHFFASTILALMSSAAPAGDEWASPSLLPGSTHNSLDPRYLLVGTEVRENRCIAWVVAEELLVHQQRTVNLIIRGVLEQVGKQAPEHCANPTIYFYRTVHDQPRNPSFRITEQLGYFDRAVNRTTFLGDDEHYGSWADGPPKAATGKAWASNAPRGEGYSIDLISVNPSPGTPLKAGSEVDFDVTVAYTNTVANKGLIVLVFQADETGMINRKVGQMSQEVVGSTGMVTLSDSLAIPDGAAELLLYVPLMPSGMRESKGQVIIRYPITKQSTE